MNGIKRKRIEIKERGQKVKEEKVYRRERGRKVKKGENKAKDVYTHKEWAQ